MSCARTDLQAWTGGVAKADADGAVNYGWKARKVRSDDAFMFVKNVLTKALGAKVADDYLVANRNSKTIDFQETFKKISAAATAGQINANQAAKYKKVIRDASKGILTNTTDKNISHWALVKSFSTFCSKGSEQAKGLTAGSPAPAPAPGGAASCAPEFKAAGSAAKRRREVMEQAINSVRRAARLPVSGAMLMDEVAGF